MILCDTLATSISSGGVMGDVGEAGAVILRLGCDINVKFKACNVSLFGMLIFKFQDPNIISITCCC